MKRRLASLVVCVGLFAALLASPTAQAVQDPYVRVALTSPIGSLNPLLASTDAARQILRYQYETLVSYDEDNRLGAGAARSWSTNDGKTWTFLLAEDRSFSDGTPLTSADVLYSFAAFMKAHDDGVTAHHEVGNVREVNAPDEYTVVIDLVRPQPNPPGVDVFIVPQHIWSAYSDPTALAIPGDEQSTVVGSGPFLLTSASETQVVMRANPLFWRGSGRVAGISWQVYGDEVAAINALVTGDVDVVTRLAPHQALALSELDQVNVVAGVGESALLLGINSGRSDATGTLIGDGNVALLDPLVRRAIVAAIDVDEIVTQAFSSLATSGATLVPPAYPFYSRAASTLPKREQGQQAAAELLQQAGYELNTYSHRVGQDGRVLSLRLEFVASDSTHQRSAMIIRKALSDLGIEVELVPSDTQSISANAATGRHDLYLTTYSAPPEPSEVLAANTCAARLPAVLPAPPTGDDQNSGDDGQVSDQPSEVALVSPTVASGWCSAAFDEAYDSQTLEFGPDRRASFIKEAFTLLYNYDSLVVLAYPDDSSAYSSDVFVSFGITPASATGAVGSTLSYWTYYLATPVKNDASGIGSSDLPESTWWRTPAIAGGIIIGAGLALWLNRKRHRT